MRRRTTNDDFKPSRGATPVTPARDPNEALPSNMTDHKIVASKSGFI
jgi:hypothetical protein